MIAQNKSTPLSPEQRELILGSLLGDLSAQMEGSIHPRVAMTHGAKQEAYLSHKANVLHQFVSTPPRWKENKGYGEWSCVVSTFTAPAFEFLCHLCYRDTSEGRWKKTVTRDWAAMLTTRALAYWYMDDGTLQAKSAHFMTHSFTQQECEILAARLREMGYGGAETRPTKKNNKTYHLVVIPTEDSRKFLQDTRPYAHESMLYKWEPTANYHACRYCREEFETSLEVKVSTRTQFICCTKVTCRRQMQRDQKARREEQRIERQPLTNARSRAARAATPKDELKIRDKVARDRRFATKEGRAKFNETRKAWRKNRKAQSIVEKPPQTHACRYCKKEFQNSLTHKMSPRSPFISCPGSECMTRRQEDYKDLRRARARERWASKAPAS